MSGVLFLFFGTVIFWSFRNLQILTREAEGYVAFSIETVTLCLNVS